LDDTTMTDGIDTSGKALVTFLKRAGDKGLMKTNTANSLRAAASQVLGVLDNWETLDVRGIDVDEASKRFVNKRNEKFTPESLEAYKRRFAQAVKLFLEYAEDPSGWRFNGREPYQKKDRTKGGTPEAREAKEEKVSPAPVMSGLVEYPFPLREGRLAYLRLPMDLKLTEVQRLTAYLKTLAVDAVEDA
jgi:hypothetical protein